MTSKLLRYLSVGLAVCLAGTAWGDTMYMFSRQDGSVYLSGAPASPRFGAYGNGSRSDRRPPRRLVPAAPANGSGVLYGKSRYDLLVAEVARGYKLDSALLHAVISVESRYDPNAMSPAGAVGLMQLMPATAKRYGVDDALDPEQNVRGGARYLRDLLSMFGSDLNLALAAYHAGENAVARHQNTIPPFQATMDFVARVMDVYQTYRGASGR